MQKSKKSSKHTNKQLCKTDMTIFYKMQKLATTTKVQQSFCHYRTKKEHKNTRENPEAKYLCIDVTNTNRSTKDLRKSELFAQ